MKKLFLAVVAILFTIAVVAEDKPIIDMSDEFLKVLKIEDVDMNRLSVADEVKNYSKDNGKINTAVSHKLSHSIQKHYPNMCKKIDERLSSVVTYRWELATKEEIQASKEFLKKVAVEHENEMVQMISFTALGTAFYEQRDVLDWLIEQLYKPIPEGEDPDLRGNILASVVNIAGEKYKTESTVALKSWLGHPVLRQRYNALKVMYMLNRTDLNFLPDVVACFTTSSASGKTNKALLGVLNSYDIKELVKYYDIMKITYKTAPQRRRTDELFKKIEAETK